MDRHSPWQLSLVASRIWHVYMSTAASAICPPISKLYESPAVSVAEFELESFVNRQVVDYRRYYRAQERS